MFLDCAYRSRAGAWSGCTIGISDFWSCHSRGFQVCHRLRQHPEVEDGASNHTEQNGHSRLSVEIRRYAVVSYAARNDETDLKSTQHALEEIGQTVERLADSVERLKRSTLSSGTKNRKNNIAVSSSAVYEKLGDVFPTTASGFDATEPQYMKDEQDVNIKSIYRKLVPLRGQSHLDQEKLHDIRVEFCQVIELFREQENEQKRKRFEAGYNRWYRYILGSMVLCIVVRWTTLQGMEE